MCAIGFIIQPFEDNELACLMETFKKTFIMVF